MTMNALSETLPTPEVGLETAFAPNFAYARGAYGGSEHTRRQRPLLMRAGILVGIVAMQIGLFAALHYIDFGKSTPLPEAIMVLDLKEATVIPNQPPPPPPKFTQPPQVIQPEVTITLAPPPERAITVTPPKPQDKAQAPATGSGSNTGAVVMNYQQSLLRHLAHHKRYPALARQKHREGVALIRFTMDRTGNVLSVVLSKSSGAAMLDEESVALLKRATPLPAPPPEVRGDPIDLVVPVEFSLN